MKKKYFAVVLVLALCLVLSAALIACDNDNDDNRGGGNTAALEQWQSSAKAEVDTAFYTYNADDYSDAEWVKLEAAHDGAKTAIEAAETEEDVTTAKRKGVSDTARITKLAEPIEVATEAELDAAIANAGSARVIVKNDIELTTGKLINIDRKLTLDLDGHRLFGDITDANTNDRLFNLVSGTLKVKNGTIDALSHKANEADTFNSKGSYGAFRVEGAESKLYLNALTLSNSRYWGLNVKVIAGYAELRNVHVNSVNGVCIEVTGDAESNHGQATIYATAELYDCLFDQKGYKDYCSPALSVSGGAVLNVHGGTYTSENFGAYIFSSGGTLNFFVGSVTSTGSDPGHCRAIQIDKDENNYYKAQCALNINGGTFSGDVNLNTSVLKMEIGTAEGMDVLKRAAKKAELNMSVSLQPISLCPRILP